MPHTHDLAPNSDVSPWLETLRLMASEMGPSEQREWARETGTTL